eukprot:1617337-Rhodomonas_salina.2
MPSRGQSKAESFLETTTPEGSKQTSNAPDGIGFIIIDGSGALFGGLTGGVRQILHRMSVELPRKPGKGGQSALRQSRHNYVTKVASMAALVFMTNNKVNIAGLVVAGSSDFKSSIVEDEKLDPRLRSKVTLVLDVPYGGEKGFNHAIKMASSIPRKVQLEHEAKIIKTWLDAVRFDTGKACFGMDSVLSALDCGAVERLLLWENLHHRRITFRSASGEEETVVLTDAQSRDCLLYTSPSPRDRG